jgi:hypothetical protein|nr:MAG TPA: hypothetical protein [Caudoviricetes sp.]
MEKKKVKLNYCSGCRHGTPVVTVPGDPGLVFCRIHNKKFVAASARVCNYAEAF